MRMPPKKTLNKLHTPWANLPQDFRPEDWAGFTYLITEISSGRMYIGKKIFWSKRRLKVKGKSRRKRVVLESDWRTYKSSNKELQALIKKNGLEGFAFEIIGLHKTRADMNYAET